MKQLNGLELVNIIVDDKSSQEEFADACSKTYRAFDTVNDIIKILDNKKYSYATKVHHIEDIMEYYWDDMEKILRSERSK